MRSLSVLFLLALSPTSGAGQRPPAFDTTGLTALVASMARVGQLPAVAVAVVGSEGPVYEAAFGLGGPSGGPRPAGAAGAEAREAEAIGDRFYLGSVSETLTAFAILRLVDDDVIDLDAPVHRYLPDLAFSDPTRTERLTIRHLLAHRSGLSPIGFFNRRVQVQANLGHVDFVREPGEKVEASGLDYLVLGMVLEAVSGQPYHRHMAERVFEPLGMRSVSADRETARSGGVVPGHRYLFGLPVATEAHAYTDVMVPAAYVASSAPDLGRFLSLLLNEGFRGDVRLLSGTGVEALLPRVVEQAIADEQAIVVEQAIADEQDGRDHGWKPLRREGGKAWYREGVSPGFHALVAVLPDEELGIVVLASRTGGPGPDAASELLDGALDLILGRPVGSYLPWERILHVALLILVGAWMVQPIRWHRRWKAVGSPKTTAHTRPIVGRLVLDLAVAGALPLVVILGMAKMSIQGLLGLYPDLGMALIVFPLAAIPTAVWRALVHSEAVRRGRL